MTEQRLTPGTRREVGALTWGFARAAGWALGTEPPRLFLTVGRHRRLFRAWIRFARQLMPGGLLPRRESELVILRVAHLRSSRYEFEHHVRLGRRAGLTEADFDRVIDGPDAPGWSAREAALLGAADEIDRSHDVSDGLWATLREHLDERELIELVTLIGHYQMVATIIETLRIQPDRARPRGRLRGRS
jgi:alkylhydroperoxidase family enzyme